MIQTVSRKIRDTELIIETGRLAKQASGTALVTYGGTVVLATVCISKDPVSADYLPLSVNYFEKYYAAGKIPGGFIKREGKPKDKEVLISRLIDRPMRPLFPDGLRNDIQIILTTLSADQQNPPDTLAMIAASACVGLSNIPFHGPVSAVRVGLINDEFVLNPTFAEIEDSKLDLVVAGTKTAITMIEGAAQEIPEHQMVEALRFAGGYIKELCELQEELIVLSGSPKIEVPLIPIDTDFKNKIYELSYDRLKQVLISHTLKLEREKAIEDLSEEILEKLNEEELEEEKIKQYHKIFHDMEGEIVRKMILEDKKRVDGRSIEDIRPITIEVGLLPRTHGSSLFTRGETQSLSIVTLGTSIDEQRFDDIEGEGTTHFILHYNFPPFSVGETGRVGGPGRREIGHGRLAERAITAVLPNKETFPYTIRIVSEILESNGSSSMATVCAGIMALLDAGVPITNSVSGIAMGLVKDSESDNYTILTDIQGMEDHLGDMDFKVAGTRDGITAFQMDLKVEGITYEIMEEALMQAKRARLSMLDIMDETLATPRSEMSAYAPKIIKMTVEVDKIKDVIGPGGKMIKGIVEKTGAQINIDDYGIVTISSKDEKSAKEAYKMVLEITADIEVGKTYKGIVRRIVDYGVFVEVLPGKDGFVHISKLAKHRVRSCEDVVKIGDELTVKATEEDNYGRVQLVALDALDSEGSTRTSNHRPQQKYRGSKPSHRSSHNRKDY